MSEIAPVRARKTTPMWGLAIASFLPVQIRSHVAFCARYLPLTVILLAQVFLSLRLENSVFEDEALYIDAGHDYLHQILSGTPVAVPYGDFFSGLPMFYPLLAAVLDNIGGLDLVRAISLACMIVATLTVRATTQHLWGQRAGNLVAVVFVGTGPVLFLGALATFDALCLALISTATWIGITRSTNRSAVLVGTFLAAATAVKYTGFIFIPVVLAVTFLASQHNHIRAVLAGVVAAALLTASYLVAGPEIQDGIAFTTSHRSALSPTSLSVLAFYLIQDIGLLATSAMAGAAVLARSPRSLFLALALLGGGALLPLAQMRLGEAVSFEKHLAYSALFLAPLAGLALNRLTQHRLGWPLVIVLACAISVTGFTRSMGMYQWPDVRPVVEIVRDTGAQSGNYLSTEGLALGYYTADDPSIVWAVHYGLFDSGREAMRVLVEEGSFKMIILRSGSRGNLTEDSQISFFREVVADSDKYQLVTEPFPVLQYAEENWFVYELATP